jgi:hypothetical protein
MNEHELAQRVCEILVALRFATDAVGMDATGTIHIAFTPRGLVLQEDLTAIFKALDDGSELDLTLLQALFTVLLKKT